MVVKEGIRLLLIGIFCTLSIRSISLGYPFLSYISVVLLFILGYRKENELFNTIEYRIVSIAIISIGVLIGIGLFTLMMKLNVCI